MGAPFVDEKTPNSVSPSCPHRSRDRRPAAPAHTRSTGPRSPGVRRRRRTRTPRAPPRSLGDGAVDPCVIRTLLVSRFPGNVPQDTVSKARRPVGTAPSDDPGTAAPCRTGRLRTADHRGLARRLRRTAAAVLRGHASGRNERVPGRVRLLDADPGAEIREPQRRVDEAVVRGAGGHPLAELTTRTTPLASPLPSTGFDRQEPGGRVERRSGGSAADEALAVQEGVQGGACGRVEARVVQTPRTRTARPSSTSRTRVQDRRGDGRHLEVHLAQREQLARR